MIRIMKSLKKGLAGKSGQMVVRWLWLVPAAATVMVLIYYNVQTFGLPGRVEKAIGRYKTMEKEIVASLGTPNKTIEQMKKKNPFSGTAPTPSIPKCQGILGQFALFGDQWYKAGDTVQDAKIVSIGPSEVKILWQEKEQTIKPFDVEVQYQKSQSGGPTPSARPQTARTAVTQGPSRMPPMPMTGGRGGFNPFNMSPDEIARMRDQFMNMSPDERRRAFEEMRGRRGQ
jgi:hypothetical protein